MISDTIDILDAKIVNLGIEFTAIATMEANKFDVLNDAVITVAASISIIVNMKLENLLQLQIFIVALIRWKILLMLTSVKLFKKQVPIIRTELMDIDRTFILMMEDTLMLPKMLFLKLNILM
jgi:hypothetical protein